MNKIETVFKIGDLVYTASSYEVDRDVIKAIKVEGLEEKVSYGIKSRGGGGLWGLWGGGDGYRWYEPGNIFLNKEEADAVHKALKTKEEAAEAKEKAERKAKRLAELKSEQEAIEKGEDPDEYDY